MTSQPNDGLPSRVRQAAGRHPDRQAAVLGERRLTYRELAAAVRTCAASLDRSGVRRGDRVAHLGAPDVDFLITFLAAGEIGAVWLGLNPRYTDREVAYVLSDASPRLVIDAVASDEDRRGLRGALRGGSPVEVVQVAELSASPDESFEPRLEHHEAAALVYTSGSTGRPKGALVRHASLVHAGEAYASQYPVARAPYLRSLCNLPINHVGCLCDVVATTICAAGTIVFMRDFEPDKIGPLIASEELTHVGQVPTMWRYILEAVSFDTGELPSLEWAIWSGAPMPRGLADRLVRPGLRLSNCYGMTETTGSVCFTDPDGGLDHLTGTIGRPIDSDNLRLRMDGTDVVGTQITGEVQVRGPWVMAGYYGDAERTAAAMDGEWFRTGDLAERTEDGSLRLVGRLKEMFKSGGYNVYPREIEEVIEAHPSVSAAAVIAAPDEVYGEVGFAFVIREGAVSADELDAWCRERVANYKVPKRFAVEDSLPLLPIGKIDKEALRRRLSSEAAA